MNNTEKITIDGNKTTKKCIYYCNYKCGWLTLKQMKLHKCLEKNCKRLFKKENGANGK